MGQWPSLRAARVLAALLRIGWAIKRQSGSHRTLHRAGWPDYTFAFHDHEEIGPKMLARIAKHTGPPMEKVREDTDRDYFMSAEEATEYGLVDRVITSH